MGEELNPYTEPPRDDFGQQEYIDKVDKANIANLYPQEKNQEELGAMAQSFNNKENSEVLRNITERLTAQNKSIEPFNEWLAGQSEAMQAADTTTQTNEYRKSLRDAIPTSESYRPIVQPATNTVEQEFINKLYASPTKLSPTQALFDELGIV
jgi:isochorismate synthase EntC